MSRTGTATQPNRLADLQPQPEVSQESTPSKPGAGINVGSVEREMSIFGGSALAILGIYHRSFAGLAAVGVGAALVYRGVTGSCGLYKALGISTAGEKPSAQPKEYFSRGIHVEQTMTIMRSAEDLYHFWRDFQNLPRFMQYLESVEVLDEKKTRWVATGPAGMSVRWDAELINDQPNELISWRSVGGADVDSAGTVRFVQAPEDRGTEVHVVMDYIPPAGKLGQIIAKMFGKDPQAEIHESLRRFKNLMETGEIPTIQGQPKGNCKGSGKTHTGT